MARLRFESITKAFGEGERAVDDVTLEVRDGEFMVFVGPSGSGKSTFLRVMAGLEAPSAGRVFIDDRDVTDAEPRERDLAMVFQAYALYPHKTVRENLEFGLRMRGMPPRERGDRVEHIARTLDIAELLERKPGQLSGGQRQRVALGRALVREPRAFLLDEPLSNLDPALRLHARTELASLHRSLQATFLYVTHDQEEAMTLGDRVAVLRRGKVEQVAPPMELYRRPATRFVAEFIGSPAMNLYRCRVTGRAGGRDGVRLQGPGFRIELDGPPADLPEEVVVGVRPHDVRRVDARGAGPVEGRDAGRLGSPDGAGARAPASAAGPEVTAVVDLVEPRGSDLLVRTRIVADDGRAEEAVLTVVLPPEPPVGEGDRLSVRFPRDRIHYFDPGTGRRLE